MENHSNSALSTTHCVSPKHEQLRKCGELNDEAKSTHTKTLKRVCSEFGKDFDICDGRNWNMCELRKFECICIHD